VISYTLKLIQLSPEIEFSTLISKLGKKMGKFQTDNLVLIICFSLLFQIRAEAQISSPINVLGNGGEEISRGSYGTVVTVGQPMIGTMGSSLNSSDAGFWNLVSSYILSPSIAFSSQVPGEAIVFPDSHFTIAVELSQARGLAAADFIITYDDSIFTVDSIQVGELLPSEDFIFAANHNTPGLINASLSGIEGILSDHGVLFTIAITVKSDAPSGSYTFRFDEATFYDSEGDVVPIIFYSEADGFSGDLVVRLADIPRIEKPPPEGIISIDFNLVDGNQEQGMVGNVEVGKKYSFQLHIHDAPKISGWGVFIAYDPKQVRYVRDSFQAGNFIDNFLPVIDTIKENSVGVGGTAIDPRTTGSGDGLLGILSFEILGGFTGNTDLTITENSFRYEEGVHERQEVQYIATITGELVASPLPGDFTGDGLIDLSDFFKFADAFGGTNPLYDLDHNGKVDFIDFFIFVDNFGKKAQAKLLVLAQELFGVPYEFKLLGNFPNPFNTQTFIVYTVPFSVGEAEVLRIYNIQGQSVRTLVDETHRVGNRRIVWDGRDENGQLVSSGTYPYILHIGKHRFNGKMTLVR